MYQFKHKKDILNFFSRFKGKDAPHNKKGWSPLPKLKEQSKAGARMVLVAFVSMFVALTLLLF